MKYTVQKLAQIAGVSVRTLHYYDAIGLLKPSFTGKNKYRYYEEQELLKLQQILFFRELEFPLGDIISMIHAPNFNSLTALKEQKKLLEFKRARIDKLIDTINKTIRKEKMNTDDLFSAFNADQMKEYQAEAKKRWGNTQAYQQSVARTKNWTKADYKRIKEEGEFLTRDLANKMEKGYQSSEFQELIKKHHQSINQFYDCSPEMYRNLGKMYVDDPRFTAYYDKFKPGLANVMQKAIDFYCDKMENK